MTGSLPLSRLEKEQKSMSTNGYVHMYSSYRQKPQYIVDLDLFTLFLLFQDYDHLAYTPNQL